MSSVSSRAKISFRNDIQEQCAMSVAPPGLDRLRRADPSLAPWAAFFPPLRGYHSLLATTRTLPPTVSSPRSLGEGSLPSSTRRAASGTPDTAAAPLLQSALPCAPSPSNFAPPYERSHRQLPRLRGKACPKRSATWARGPRHPHSSATLHVRAHASGCESAHPS